MLGSGLLSPTHIIFVLVIALVVLGPKRIPEAARSLGHGMRGFKHALEGEDSPDEKPHAEQLSLSAETRAPSATAPPAPTPAD